MKIVRVRLREETFRTKTGEEYFIDPARRGWQEIIFEDESKDCEHIETMCDECLELWENDHEIRF